MRKASLALAVVTLAFTLTLPAAQSLADDAADVEAVERELEAEAMAIELYERAVERANKAVAASSLGKKVARLWNEFWSANDAFEETRAYREYLGPDKLEVGCFGCSDAEREAKSAERDARLNRYHEARRSFRIAEIVEERDAAHLRMNALRNKMVLKFLADEIAKAAEQKLNDLERELREINKRVKKGLTI